MSDGVALLSAIDALADGEVGCYDIASNLITATGSWTWISVPSGASVKAFSSTGNGVISGGDTTRMFDVGSGSTLDLEGLTLSDGNAVSSVSNRAARRAFVS